MSGILKRFYDLDILYMAALRGCRPVLVADHDPRLVKKGLTHDYNSGEDEVIKSFLLEQLKIEVVKQINDFPGMLCSFAVPERFGPVTAFDEFVFWEFMDRPLETSEDRDKPSFDRQMDIVLESVVLDNGPQSA